MYAGHIVLVPSSNDGSSPSPYLSQWEQGHREYGCTGVSGVCFRTTPHCITAFWGSSRLFLEERLWDFHTGYPSLCPPQQCTWFPSSHPHQYLLAVYLTAAFLMGMRWSLKVFFTLVWGSWLLNTFFSHRLQGTAFTVHAHAHLLVELFIVTFLLLW